MPMDLLRESASKYFPSEYYGTILGAIIVLAFLHSWAKGPALLVREERLEATQRAAREKGQPVRVTAGLNDMGARVVLIAVRCETHTDGCHVAAGPRYHCVAGAPRRAHYRARSQH